MHFKLELKRKTSQLDRHGIYSPRSGVYNKMVQYLCEVA